jgi:Flp pilus assembly protein TadD
MSPPLQSGLVCGAGFTLDTPYRTPTVRKGTIQSVLPTLIFLACACTRAPQSPATYALLPFDNLTGDTSLDWMARTAPRIAAAELPGTARPAGSIDDAYLEKANRFVHGYFTKTANTLRLTIEVEDSVSHKMVSTQQLDGSVLSCVTALAKSLASKAEPFSTSNDDAIAAWGRGDFERAVTLDPAFGTAWLSWIETLARSGDTAGAIAAAGRALEHPVKSELDGMRIELARATLAKDSRAERDALVKLTARVADPVLLDNLGAIEIQSREFALAEADYRKILAVKPDSANTWNQLGYALGFQGKLEEAQAAFAEYGKQPGRAPNSVDSLGEVYFMNGKFNDAEKAFLRARAPSPSGGDLRRAAYSHWLAGDLPGADKIFVQYLNVLAKAPMRGGAYPAWQMASWEFTTGRREKAIADLPAQSAFPQAADQLRVWRGELKLPTDLAELKKAYEASQPTSDGLYRTLYAEALLANGQKNEAKKLAARWPLPDNAGDPVLQSLVFPKYLALRRILGL